MWTSFGSFLLGSSLLKVCSTQTFVRYRFIALECGQVGYVQACQHQTKVLTILSTWPNQSWWIRKNRYRGIRSHAKLCRNFDVLEHLNNCVYLDILPLENYLLICSKLAIATAEQWHCSAPVQVGSHSTGFQQTFACSKSPI